jgi:hypothetical protein
MAGYWTKWKRTTSALKWTRGCTYLPECCACRRPANETQVSFFTYEPNTPIDEIGYCLPSPKFRCEPGKGCNAAPWSKAGMDWRWEMATWHDGVPAFVRKRDGARLRLQE